MTRTIEPRQGSGSALPGHLGEDRLARIRATIRWIVEAGTQGYPPDVKRRLVVMNLIAYLIALSTAGYAIQHMFLDVEKYGPVIVLNLALVLTAILVPFSHRISDLAGAFIIIGSEYAALMVFTAYLGNTSGLHLQYFIGAAATFVVFGVKRWPIVVPLVVLPIILHIYAWFNFPREAALIDAPADILDGIYIQASITTGVLIAAAIYYAFHLAEAAKAETDALLRNILPDDVVERLKTGPGSGIADNFKEASILFADISGFVALSRKLGPDKIVSLLNTIVSEFDELADRHGVEKIKTIGDAYMVAAGVPIPVSDHTQRLARMGIDMLAVVRRVRAETGHDLHMRVGLASGPVMAGIIGTRKFSYDIWGDAVNLAARLENMSQRGRILVCPETKKALDGIFEFETRGAIEIKGVGTRETWFLTGERCGVRADGDDDYSPEPERMPAAGA